MKLLRFLSGLAILAGSALVLTAAPGASAAPTGLTFTVNQTADLTDAALNDDRCDTSLLQSGDQCSLRAAIQQANAYRGRHNQICFDRSTYPHANGGDNDAERGDLDITESVTLEPIPNGRTVIRGGSNFTDRIFDIHKIGVTVTFNRLSIQNGDAGGGDGGGILVEGATPGLILNNSVVSENRAFNGGGIAEDRGLVTLNDSVISNNTATLDGGGLYVTEFAHVIRSTIADNSAGRDGGGIGINFGDPIDIRFSTISNNTAGRDGGGMFMIAQQLANADNSTFSGNQAKRHGGGIFIGPRSNFDVFHARSVTISNNTADSDNLNGGDGGGVYALPGRQDDFDFANSVIAGNLDNSTTPKSPDCHGVMVSAGFVLIGNTTGCVLFGNAPGNKLNVNALLAPLADNGGPILTDALQARSPAIDGVSFPFSCQDGDGNELTVDQRGFPRPRDGDGDLSAVCDMGAFEVGAVGIGSLSPNYGSSAPGEQVVFDLAWDSPTRWRNLHTLDLRFKHRKETRLWLRFTEGLPTSTISLLDEQGTVIDSGNVGDAKKLKNRYGSVELAASGFTASGPDDPHVVIHLAVRFKQPAQGKLQVEMAGTDDFGNFQGPEPAGKWRVQK